MTAGRSRAPPRLARRLAALALLALAAAAAARGDSASATSTPARIFSEYTARQEAQARFDRQVQGWRDEAAEKEKLVNQLRAEVRDQSPILSSLKRQEKEEALQKAISDYERFIQDVWGPQGRAAQENDRATARRGAADPRGGREGGGGEGPEPGARRGERLHHLRGQDAGRDRRTC